MAKKKITAKDVRAVWITPVSHEPYNAKKHLKKAHKFLFWINGRDDQPILLVGERGGENGGIQIHDQLLKTALTIGVGVPTTRPDGAGECWEMQVCGWRSTGFDLDTPKALKKLIEGVILGTPPRKKTPPKA